VGAARLPALSAALRFGLHAFIAGVIFGVGARVDMRLIAHSAGLPPGSSWGGTAEVVLVGALIATPTAAGYWLIRRSTWSRWWWGVGLSALLFAVLAAWPPPSAASALEALPGSGTVAGLLFGSQFLMYGAALEWWWQRGRPTGRTHVRS
jgi:hypothetical protein